MTIGIDARMLGSGYGIGRYIEQLVIHLELLDQHNQYVLFLRKDNWDAVTLKGGHMKKVLADIPWYTAKEQLFLPAIFKKEGVDLMHFPHWNVPMLYPGKFVVTIHDLTMFHYPRPEATTHGPIVYYVKDWMHRTVLARATRRAAHIFVPSDFTKQDVHRTFAVSKEKITTTYLAPVPSVFAQDTGQDILVQYGITQPYVLYVGAAYPHKNVERLVRAWALVRERSKEPCRLVLVGKESPFYARLEEKMRDRHLWNDVVYTGFVPDRHLPHVYAQASLFVFPSLYEGFGLPPLEAMVHGVPVVASSAACIPEIIGEAAVYVDPENIEQMADAIHSVLRHDDIRSQLRENAQQELRRYSWERLARQTIAVYDRFR